MFKHIDLEMDKLSLLSISYTIIARHLCIDSYKETSESIQVRCISERVRQFLIFRF